jgi:hypothetical protein
MGRLTITSIFDELAEKYIESEQKHIKTIEGLITPEEEKERMETVRLYVSNAREMLQRNLDELWNPSRSSSQIKDSMKSDVRNAKRGL